MLLIILLAIPLMGAIIHFFIRKRDLNIVFLSSLLLLLASLGLRGLVRGEAMTYILDFSGPFKLILRADGLSFIFLFLAAFLWLVVSIYAAQYMEEEARKWAFNLASLVTLFSVTGIFLSGDLLTLLLFFELMTVSSYFWVIHSWNKEAIRAGYFYLFFSIVGGLLLALAIVFIGASVESLPMIGQGPVQALDPKLFAWGLAICLAGFGIKAGMVPLHLWLPYAHSVAPTPASALLSGLLIKIGAYGLIRVGEFAGWGLRLGQDMAWLGSGLIILGCFTMLLGVTSALIQSDGKKLLAYHSISQMGYIILGLGIGLYLGSDGAYGLAGSVYHIINHALFKVALFLGLGVIYIYTGERDLYKMGGLWKKFPLTALLMFLAVLGITGAPGLNGYASKSLLHHGVSLAAEKGGAWLIWVERLFLLIGVGTAASFSKLYYLVFLGKDNDLKIRKKSSVRLHLAMILLILVMLLIGIRPELLLRTALLPSLKGLGMVGIEEALLGLSFWNLKDIVDMFITLGLGILVCFLGFKTGAFHLHPPLWLTIEGLAGFVAGGISKLVEGIINIFTRGGVSIKGIINSLNSRAYKGLEDFDQERRANLWGLDLIGIAGDIGILFLVLTLLMGIYILL